MPQSIRNPYFRQAVGASRQLVYEAEVQRAPFTVVGSESN
jgi:hypothetical protein